MYKGMFNKTLLKTKKRSHLMNSLRKIKRQILEFKWNIKIYIRFWLLQHLFIKDAIYVYEWTDFDAKDKEGKLYNASWLDVTIKLPSLFPFFKSYYTWIFTVESMWAFLNYKPLDDVDCTVFLSLHENNKKLYKEYLHLSMDRENECKIINWIKDHKNIIFKHPFIEFDSVWTCQDTFTKNDVVKYTKMWIRYNYPKLYNREIKFVEQESIK